MNPNTRSDLLTPYLPTDTWAIGELDTPKGKIPVVSTKLEKKDILGGWKVRWGIGRMDYTVNPGLYAVGHPDASSPVLVSSNYKLTFDSLRKELDGLNLWLLILDTNGVNVWCSAGKGTFGTAELLKRMALTGLPNLVEHRTLILPQLAAVGVCAHEVKRRSGFDVVYGTIRAEDIKAFLSNGMTATPEMREVRFDLRDRIVLTPMELVPAMEFSIPVLAVLYLINLFAARPIGLPDFLTYCAAILTGAVLVPTLLPFLPGRAFVVKGWTLGAVVTAALCVVFGWFTPGNFLLGIGYMLALPALAAYLAMNFTGSSTYTGRTGVLKEMEAALFPIILCIFSGCVLLFIKAVMG